MKVIPIRSVVVIRPDEIEDKSAGGLYLPDSSRDRMQYAVDRGVVVSTGDGFFEGLRGPKPEIGDRVIFDKYKGTLITIEEEDKKQRYRLINDDEIIAILEE